MTQTELEKIITKYPLEQYNWFELSRNQGVSRKFKIDNSQFKWVQVLPHDPLSLERLLPPAINWQELQPELIPYINWFRLGNDTKVPEWFIEKHLKSLQSLQLQNEISLIENICPSTRFLKKHFRNNTIQWQWKAFNKPMDSYFIQFVIENKNLNWNWYSLSRYIPTDFLMQNQLFNWNYWEILLHSEFISIEFINFLQRVSTFYNSTDIFDMIACNYSKTVYNLIDKHPDQMWNWNKISQFNPHITCDFVEKHHHKINFSKLSQNQTNHRFIQSIILIQLTSAKWIDLPKTSDSKFGIGLRILLQKNEK